MNDWVKILRIRNTTMRVNANLAGSLAHCLPLEAGGWHFRCVECHVSTGAYTTGFGYGWHSHQEYQIEIAVGGVFEFASATSEKIVVRPGGALLIPWKMAHRWKCVKPGVLVGISLNLLPTPASILRDGWLIENIRQVVRRPIKVMVDGLLDAALNNSHPPFHSKITACRLFLLLAEILGEFLPSDAAQDKDAPTKVAAGTRGREVVGWVARHLDESLGGNVNLTQVAREVGMSSRQVHRLFLRHVGKSPHDYLLERRLGTAWRLLVEQGSKLQVKEIAFSCGFNSLAYFSNCFRKAYGVAPSSLLLEEVSLKSGFTVKSHENPEEAPGASSLARKRASASAKSRARG